MAVAPVRAASPEENLATSSPATAPEPSGYWYDGRWIDSDRIVLDAADPGLRYGATTFTTLRVYGHLDAPPTQWARHCDRLRRDAAMLEFDPPDWDRLRQGAERVAAIAPVVRMALFPDGREWIVGRSLPTALPRWQETGAIAWVADDERFRRAIAPCKTGNYLPPWLAGRAARSRGADEAILTDADGNWLETATGTLWGWRDGRWWTPPDATALPGIAAAWLRDRLAAAGTPAGEAVWTPDWARGCEALAYTNCAVEVVPLARLLDWPRDLDLPRSRSLAAAFQAIA